MISYEQALKIVLADAERLASKTIALDDAMGQVAAADILAQENLPPFHTFAMDGFA